MELGSVFDGEASASSKARDLRWEVGVPPHALGQGQGVWVDIPDKLPLRQQPEERAPRQIRDDDPPGQILLHLPENLPSGATLRLRGQGEAGQDRAAGDLYLTIRLDPAAKVTALARRGPDAMAPFDAFAGATKWWWLILVAIAGIWMFF